MRNQTSISLSLTRGAQLRELARIKGSTVADLVAGWIVREYDSIGAASEFEPCATSLEHGLNATMIRADFFTGEHETRLTPAQATGLACTIRNVVRGVHAALDLDAGGAIVQRRGVGVQLIVGGWSKVMSLDVATEIAGELQAAADAARG